MTLVTIVKTYEWVAPVRGFGVQNTPIERAWRDDDRRQVLLL